jgi:hypothetical protein
VRLLRSLFLLLPWLSPPLLAQTRVAADLGRAVVVAGLDPSECYRVRDLEFSEEDARFYLTEGYLIFGKPVNGAPLSAVFSGDVDGGDAELILLPPDRSERKSLASYTGSPNLDEHFRTAIFLFTEPRARALLDRVRSAATAKKLPDIGALMAGQWNRTLANIESSYESRVVLDLLSPEHAAGFFEAVIQGRKLGNFDFLHDRRSPESLLAGQIVERKGAPYWDTWFSYPAEATRSAQPSVPEEEILGYNIDASLDADLVLHCATSIRFKATIGSSHVIPFDLSGQMRATSATLDGTPAEVYERESLRGGLVQNTGNELLLVIPPKALEPGSEHTVRIQHEGKVVLDAGNHVFYVSARGTWYPGRGLQFAKYDVTYRYPAGLDLIAAGRITEDRREGDIRITRRAPEGRIRLLGLNLGSFEHKSVARDGIQVNAWANRTLEEALRPHPQAAVDESGPSFPVQRRRVTPPLANPNPGPPLTPNPAGQLSTIAEELADELVFYRARFGDPALLNVEATPLPGRFGQGFAGMIYLPTVTYFLPQQTHSASPLSLDIQTLFRTVLRAHEAAHQWWGNVVAAGSYHHEWLMEALASYSALMFVEARNGPKASEAILENYRRGLLAKGPDGESAESEGPVVQGRRLDSSNNPAAWMAVIYGKGTWIIQMLRRRMGDDRFLAMLAELRKRYEWKTLDTEQFRALCAEFVPPKSDDAKLERFFDQWVYGTGVPELKLTYSVKGKPGAYRLTGSVAQSGVPDDFTVRVPIEIQTTRGVSKTVLVATGADPAPFSIPVSSANAKAVLDPHGSVLRR